MSNKQQHEHFRVGITHGDFNGVGMEVILKTFAETKMFDYCSPVLYGSPRIFAYYKKQLGIQEPSYNLVKSGQEGFQKHKINLKAVWDEEVEIAPGKDSAVAGKAALRALEGAVADIKAGFIDAIVTAPINKKNIAGDDFPYAGHTDYLAKQFDTSSYLMFLVAEKLRVGLATGHVPVSQVSSRLSTELILDKLNIMKNSLVNDFAVNKPRIAVLGLNPHAGDGGVIGSEEQDIIMPAIAKARENDIMVFGPYGADGFFASGQFEKYDGILAMYHDQGLIPFKYMAFDDGVNYTAGLPVIRTSPDHGTAYNIAGKNQASEHSFRNAIFLARDIFYNRIGESEIRKNPLKYSMLKREKFRMDF